VSHRVIYNLTPYYPDIHAARLCVSALPGADTYNCVIQLYACYYDCTHTWWRCERIVYTPSPGSRLYRYWHISTNSLISSHSDSDTLERTVLTIQTSTPIYKLTLPKKSPTRLTTRQVIILISTTLFHPPPIPMHHALLSPTFSSKVTWHPHPYSGLTSHETLLARHSNNPTIPYETRPNTYYHLPPHICFSLYTYTLLSLSIPKDRERGMELPFYNSN
jgi:hypothetical protein